MQLPQFLYFHINPRLAFNSLKFLSPEISQTEKTKYYIILLRYIDVENRWAVARGGGMGMGEMSEGSEKVQISSYKINVMGTIVNNTVLHI